MNTKFPPNSYYKTKNNFMKKIIFCTFLFLGSFCFSQSVTERYNSLYKRYEYFNSSGNMIGYKQYNSLSREWEYFDQNNTQIQKQPRQYGEYAQPYNLDLMESVLSQKQQIYKYNYQKIQSTITEIVDITKDSNLDSETKYKIIKQFSDAISKNLDNQSIDYSSEEQTSSIISWLWKTIRYITERVN